MNPQNELVPSSWATGAKLVTPTSSRRNSSVSLQSADGAKLQTQLAPMLLDDSGHYSSSSNASDFGAGNESDTSCAVARFQNTLREKDQALFLALQDVRKLRSELERLDKSEQWYKQELRAQKTTRLDTLERLYTQERKYMRENQRLQSECVRLYERCGEVEKELEAERQHTLRQLVTPESAPSEQPDAAAANAIGQEFEIEQQIALIDDQQHLIAILRKQKRALLDDLKLLAEEKDEKILNLKHTLANIELENTRITTTCKQLLDERNRLAETLQRSESQLESESAEKSRLQKLTVDLRQQLDAQEALLAVKETEIKDMQSQFEANLRYESNMDEVHRLSMAYHSEIHAKAAEISALKTAVLGLQEEIGSLADLQTRNEQQERLIEHLRFTLDARTFELDQLKQTEADVAKKTEQIAQLRMSLSDCRGERARTLEQLNDGEQTLKCVEKELIGLHERYASMCVLSEQTKFVLDMREIELGKLRLQTDDDRAEIEQLRSKLRVYLQQTATLSQRIAELEADRHRQIEEKVKLVSRLGALEARLQKSTEHTRITKATKTLATDNESDYDVAIDPIEALFTEHVELQSCIEREIKEECTSSTEMIEEHFGTSTGNSSDRRRHKSKGVFATTSSVENSKNVPKTVCKSRTSMSTKEHATTSLSVDDAPSVSLRKVQSQLELRAKAKELQQSVSSALEPRGHPLVHRKRVSTRDGVTQTEPVQGRDVVNNSNANLHQPSQELANMQPQDNLLQRDESSRRESCSEAALDDAELLCASIHVPSAHIVKNQSLDTARQKKRSVQYRAKRSKTRYQSFKEKKSKHRDSRTMQALMAKNAKLRQQLAESSGSVGEIVRLEKLLASELNKQCDDTELKEALGEHMELRRMLETAETGIRITNLGLLNDAPVGMEMADKDKDIANLEEDLSIYDKLYQYYHMDGSERMQYLREILKNLTSKLNLMRTILSEWEETFQQLTEARTINEALQDELGTLREELEELNASFARHNVEHHQQLRDIGECLHQHSNERCLDVMRHLFDESVATSNAKFDTKVDQLMRETEQFEEALNLQLSHSNSLDEKTRDGHNDKVANFPEKHKITNSEVGRPKDVPQDNQIASDNDIEGRQAAIENLELQYDAQVKRKDVLENSLSTCGRQKTIRPEEIRLGPKKREAMLLEKINSLPLDATTDDGSNLIDDLKNLLQLSAAVTGRPKTIAILELIQRSNSCAPNLNKLEATVEELHDDIERLVDGLKEAQLRKQVAKNVTRERAAPSLLEELRAASE